DFTPTQTDIAAIAINQASGEVYVAGYTAVGNVLCASTATPGCINGAQSTFGGIHDGFVARLNANLTQLLQATYIGGSGVDHILAMTIHPLTGEVLVAGQTTSADLP